MCTNRATLKQIGRSLERAEDNAAYLKAASDRQRVDEERTKLKAWMACDNVCPEENQEVALSRRQSGTGIWFLEEPSFLEWLSTSNGLMWIYGIRK